MISDGDLIAALESNGWNRGKTARALGVDLRGMLRRIKKMEARGDIVTQPSDSQFTPKAYSTLRDGDGNIKLVWEKTERNTEIDHEAVRLAVEAILEPVKGLAKPIKAPKSSLSDSLSAFLIGDAHFGCYAWEAEAGANFDTDTASRDLRAAIDHLVDTAPESETGLLVDVGDYLHADNRSNMTPASGNLLDVDTRYQRVIRIAIDALRYCIGRMLQKHQNVSVIIAQGNHNPDSAGWMALCLSMYYDNEPRVHVSNNPGKFHYYEFGKCLIGVTHGDKIKLADLPSIMATDKPMLWGNAKHRYWWTGHIHHTKHLEFRGCTVEAFNTLAASDAWHHASGYRSMRQMQRIDLDRNHGIYSRAICNLGMIGYE